MTGPITGKEHEWSEEVVTEDNRKVVFVIGVDPPALKSQYMEILRYVGAPEDNIAIYNKDKEEYNIMFGEEGTLEVVVNKRVYNQHIRKKIRISNISMPWFFDIEKLERAVQTQGVAKTCLAIFAHINELVSSIF